MGFSRDQLTSRGLLSPDRDEAEDQGVSAVNVRVKAVYVLEKPMPAECHSPFTSHSSVLPRTIASHKERG